MAESLIDKLRKSRETIVHIDGLDFTVRRMNKFDFADIGEKGETASVRSICKRCVTGWPGMTELKLGIPGGTNSDVPFDADLFMEWLAEKESIWQVIYSHIWKDYLDREGLLNEEEKKQKTGSNLQDSQPELTG